MKRSIGRILAALLALTLLASFAQAAESGYSDVPQTHWAAQSVERCARLGLMQGIGGGKFGLGQTMTRAQYATALCRLMGWEMISPEKGSFRDNQDKARWYFSAIETAYAHGALTHESELCRPTEAITREEMAKMTIRALGYSMLAGVAGECPFSDVSVAKGYITLAYRMGIIKGVRQGTFEPKVAATREQAAAVLLRAYDRLHGLITVEEGEAQEGSVAAESITEKSGSVPVSPRAPMESVYTAAVRAGEGGSVTICATALMQKTRNGKVRETKELTQEELDELLGDEAMRTHHSEQHQSSCVYRTEKDGTTTVVWYESDEDIAEKVELCRMLGIRTVYIQR